MSKQEKRNRNIAIGLYRRHKAGETIREIAKDIGKTESHVSKRIKVGERFSEEKP